LLIVILPILFLAALGRDGWENIINVQMIIDLLNARNEEGVVAFLDQEKVFDMVSFTTINTVFTKLNWLDRFHAVLQTIYHKNHIQARVKANGIISKEDFLVNSGTRQSCPLSPLIYAAVADLYNMAVINRRSFKVHETLPGNFIKISAYADDIAVHLGLLANVKLYSLLLQQYFLATSGVTNFNKSEGVLCEDHMSIYCMISCRDSPWMGTCSQKNKGQGASLHLERGYIQSG
jgi:hypothetical protein